MTFHTTRFPATRLGTIDVCEIGRRRHHVVALAEMDVQNARGRLRALRRQTGAGISFTAWLVACVARAASEHPSVHALYLGGRKLAVFGDVDVTVLVERGSSGSRVPLPYVCRAAQGKSAAEISEELARALREPLAGQTVLGDPSSARRARLYARLPAFARRLFWRRLLRSPRRAAGTMGTVAVTSLGGFGRMGAWILPISIFPLTVGLGTVTRKPVAAGDAVQIHDVLHATILFDHDVIDGAPAARFAARLGQLVEQAWGLEEPYRAGSTAEGSVK